MLTLCVHTYMVCAHVFAASSNLTKLPGLVCSRSEYPAEYNQTPMCLELPDISTSTAHVDPLRTLPQKQLKWSQRLCGFKVKNIILACLGVKNA